MLTVTQAAATAKMVLTADGYNINTPRSDVIMLGVSETTGRECWERVLGKQKLNVDLFKFRVYF